MNTKTVVPIFVATSLCLAGVECLSAQTPGSATYSGNGDTSFGGAIGGGTLSLSDNGTTLSGTITKGSGNFNDALVLYIESGSGGFSSTSGFNDAGDGLRKAISGIDGSGNRSTMTFTGGFAPNYAIVLGPANDSFGGVWQLANGNNNSLNYSGSANLSPLNNSSSTYTFSLSLSEIGVSSQPEQTFELFGTYISDTGYRSSEAIAGNDTGSTGYNSYTETTDSTYVTTPEPASIALLAVGGVAAFALRRRRKC